MKLLLRCAGAAVLAGGLGLAGPASAQLAAADCFHARDWRGWASPGPGTIYLRIGADGVYRAEVAGTHILGRDRTFEVTMAPGRQSVCEGGDVRIRSTDAQGAAVLHPVMSLARLDAAEIAALPAEHRP